MRCEGAPQLLLIQLHHIHIRKAHQAMPERKKLDALVDRSHFPFIGFSRFQGYAHTTDIAIQK